MGGINGRTLGDGRFPDVHLVEMCRLFGSLSQLDCIFENRVVLKS
jgi:hypothetical protein